MVVVDLPSKRKFAYANRGLVRRSCRASADAIRILPVGRARKAEGPLMARCQVLLAAAMLCLAGLPQASACEGTEVIFEDKFADDAGGWAINQDVEVKDGSFVFKLPPVA